MEISRSNLAVDSGFSSSRNIAHYAEHYYCRAIALARPNTTRTQADTAGRTTRHNTPAAPLPRCTPTALPALNLARPPSVPAPREPAKLQRATSPKLRSRSASSCRCPLRRPVACARPCDYCDHLRQVSTQGIAGQPVGPFAPSSHACTYQVGETNGRAWASSRFQSRSQPARSSLERRHPPCTLSAACPSAC
jgi:hypothetical protein